MVTCQSEVIRGFILLLQVPESFPVFMRNGQITKFTSAQNLILIFLKIWGGKKFDNMFGESTLLLSELTSTAQRWHTKPTTPSPRTPGGAGWTTPRSGLWWRCWPPGPSPSGRRSPSTTTTAGPSPLRGTSSVWKISIAKNKMCFQQILPKF